MPGPSQGAVLDALDIVNPSCLPLVSIEKRTGGPCVKAAGGAM